MRPAREHFILSTQFTVETSCSQGHDEHHTDIKWTPATPELTTTATRGGCTVITGTEGIA
jgi:hypothetical protein